MHEAVGAIVGAWKEDGIDRHTSILFLIDIGETTNLARQKPEAVKKLEQALEEWQNQTKPPAWPSKPTRREGEAPAAPRAVRGSAGASRSRNHGTCRWQF